MATLDEHSPDILGMSALSTATMPSMMIDALLVHVALLASGHWFLHCVRLVLG